MCFAFSKQEPLSGKMSQPRLGCWGTVQSGRAQAGAQAAPWGQAKARCQGRGAQPGPIRAERVGTRLRRSAPDGAVGPWGRDGLRSVTRGGWTLAWKMGAHLSREGEMGEAHRMGSG